MLIKDFRIVFMGTPEFAVGSLKSLIDAGFNIVGVVTAPDRLAGRGQKMQEPDVKKFAKEKNLPILQPEKLKDPVFQEQLKSLHADLFVVVAFRMLPEVVWSMPKYGTINLHASLLPNYRGAAPINWAIINGETETGVTTFLIEKEIDTGKILLQEKVPVYPDDNAGLLHDKLMIAGANLIVKTVSSIISGNSKPIDQVNLFTPGETLKPAPKIFKEDCKIDWNKPIDKIYDFIRGLSPYPTAWTGISHSSGNATLSIKIFDVSVEKIHHKHSVATIVTDNRKYLKIAVNGGYIYINTLQLEGKKKLLTEEFLRGFKISEYSLYI